MRSVKIGGHRGMGCTDSDFHQNLRDVTGRPVENTLESLKAAFAAGADYVETDAVMSADGILFVLHSVKPKDHFFGALPSLPLNKMPFSEIESFRTGRLQKGRVTRLSDILDALAEKDPGTAPWVINIEIKGVQGSGQPYETNDFIRKLAETVSASKLPPERVLFSSFCLRNIVQMSRHLPQANYGMLFTEKPQASPIYADHGNDFFYQSLPFNKANVDRIFKAWSGKADGTAKLAYLHPEVTTITQDGAARAAAHGAGINCWKSSENLTPGLRQVYRRVIGLCAGLNVPLSIITDYAHEMSAEASRTQKPPPKKDRRQPRK